MLRERKLYVILLSFLIISQIGGLYGGALTFTRVLTICFSFLVFNKNFLLFINKKDRFLFQFFLINIFYCVILILVYNSSLKVNEYIYLFLNILLVLELTYLSQYIDGKYEILWKAWTIFIALTIPVAFYEIIFNFHLPVAYQQENYLLKGVGVEKKFASITFGNYNLYNNIIAFSIPIVLSKVLVTTNRKIKFISVLVALACFSIVAINGSRGTLISLTITFFLVLCFYFYKNRAKSVKNVKLIIVFLPAVFFVIYKLYVDNVFDLLLYRLQNQGFEDNVRSRLIEAGILMTEKSNFLGVGAGNFVEVSQRMNLGLGELPPHNLFIEILSQYGFLLLLVFLFFLYNIYKNISRVEFHIKYILYASLISLPINFVINSGYLNVAYMWAYFGTLYILSNYTKRTI